MTKQGILLLPPTITDAQAQLLYIKLADVAMQVGGLKSEFRHAFVGESLLSLFSLAESVQSTRIEGTQVTFSEMVDPTAAQRNSSERQEVLNYQSALSEGIRLLREGMPFSARLILQLHKTLMVNARGTSSAGGAFRKIQNFIGPDNRIEHAAYIPIGANDIAQYLENLEYYMNGIPHASFRKFNKTDGFVLDEQIHPILRLAVMHAQFESIHPFLDGNGRLGRILIALMAMKFGIVDAPIFLISEELEKERARYYECLNGVRGDDPDWYPWLSFFVECSGRMAEKLLQKMQQSIRLADEGLKQLHLDSERKVWLASFSDPCLTSKKAADMAEISILTARRALSKLADLKLLQTPTQLQRRHKYLNYDLMRIING